MRDSRLRALPSLLRLRSGFRRLVEVDRGAARVHDRLLLQRCRRVTQELTDRQSTGPESRLLVRHQARLPNHLLQHLSLRSLTADLTLPVQLRFELPTPGNVASPCFRRSSAACCAVFALVKLVRAAITCPDVLSSS